MKTAFRRLFGKKPPPPATTPLGEDMLLGAAGPWAPTHRHRKGGAYRVLAHATLEADRSEAVVYDDAEGNIWVRSRSEFYDGRFIAIKTDPS